MKVIIINKNSKDKEEKEKLNVCAYARVSTEKDDQLTSFESQKKYYETKIKQNDKWNYVKIYADEGISGTSLEKRENFLLMIKDAMAGKIDIILTKSISRFARNTMDTLKYVRELKERNIAVVFEEENINTLDEAGEFLITVLSSVAQQEVENMSAHVRKGHAMLLKSGNLLLGNGCYGYKFINEENKIEIVPEEAKVVKKIFKLYLKGTSCREIARILDKANIKTYRNVKKWVPSSVRYILTNEKYTGDLLQGKQVKLNPFVKKAKNKGQSDKYLIRNFHKPIISREDFDKAQELIKENNHSSSSKEYTKLSYKVKCGYCYSSVNVVRYKKGKAFVECTNRKKNGRESCPQSKDMIKNKVFSIIKKGLKNSINEILNNNDNDLTYVKNIIKSDTTNFENEVLGKIIKLVFVGGYDSYNRPMPFMIRVVLFNNYPLNDYMIKKLTMNEIKSIKTKKLYEGWISERITHYGIQGNPYKRVDISKVKIKIEIEKSEDCTLV